MNTISTEQKYICKKCPSNNCDDCGPWEDTNSETFKRIKQIHKDHPGWQQGDLESDSFDSAIDYVSKSVTDAEKIANKKNIQREKEIGSPIKQIEHYLNSIVKDDKKLVKKLLRVSLSAYTRDPLNLGIMAPTSEGKTYATVQVTNLFPKDDVIFVGRMSPTALIHQKGILVDKNGVQVDYRIRKIDEEIKNNPVKKGELKKEKDEILKGAKNLVDLTGKILVFVEPPDIKLWDIIKPILSHDKNELEFRTTQSDGSLIVKETIIRGFPAVIFCSAKNEKKDRIWDEIETRFDISSPNTSVEKYKQANRFTALKMGTPSLAKGMISNVEDEKFARYHIRRIKDSMIKLTKNNKNPVWNSFNGIIGEIFPSNDGISMRNLQRLMSYANVESLINSDRNPKIQFKSGDEYEQIVVTTIDDIDSVVDIIGDVSEIPPDKINFFNDVFVPALKETVDEWVTTDVLSEKYMQVYHKDTTPKKILETYVKPLDEDYGILESKINPDNKKQYLYRVSIKPNVNSYSYIPEAIIEESKNHPSFVKEGIEELEEFSNEELEFDSVLDKEGGPLSKDKLQEIITEREIQSKVFEKTEE
ncbi:hypothetical protein [Candidatus Nitrosopumilus sediminis]|uniref:Uncharacterized protein n=1 Tax=Candidatus Nitrosopumilus sediminis TaxID=1229909 RepID=K0BGI6_9ARCH|nr:hypothetical protein [Candidatus Nitrosopumilus sediminis]AFS83371.1 hypothetical protein NSED_07895 [Candidatus Nitrosopumilus sediminis]